MAGAGYVRSLPLLRLGLLGSGSVYALRGLLVVPLLLIMACVLQSPELIPPQGLASSLVSLFIGILYLAGTITGWHELQSRTKNCAA